jgi:acyl-CoA synthetase (AMP-forming)/AMP-acid ligase II
VAIVATPGSSPSETDLKAWAAQRLADYKVPVEWTFLDEMPLNASGKILKRKLAGAAPGSDSVVG